MTPRSLPLLVTAAALATFALAIQRPASPLQAERLEASDQLRWYKGNMHTHSHWSDGDDYLESIAQWYRDHDYQFLVFTDHNVLATTEKWVDVEKTKGGRKAFDKLQASFPDWVEQRTVDGKTEVRLRRFDEVAQRFNSPEKYLLIQGEEISDAFHNHPIHINAGNVVELIQPRHGSSIRETIQNNIDAVIAQREATGRPIIVHLNHPNFRYAVTAEDIMPIVGDKFFEVYNGHPGVHNRGDAQRAGAERIWDIVLTKRLAELGLPLMYGLAVDDGHNYHNIPSRASEPGRGWVWVLSPALTAEALIHSLEAGRFYASNGVVLQSVETSAQGLSVDVQPAAGETYTIEFIGTRRGYPPEGRPVLDKDGQPVETTLLYSDLIGEVLAKVEGTSARYKFRGDEIYVRARVTSSALHPNPSEEGDVQTAWVQPILGPAAPKDLETAVLPTPHPHSHPHTHPHTHPHVHSHTHAAPGE